MSAGPVSYRPGIRPVPAGTPSPVRLWAGVGALAVLVQLWVWVRFLVSGPHQLTRYRDPHSAAHLWAVLFEIALAVVVVLTVGLTARGALRVGRLTTNARLLIAFASIIWLDPLLNYLRPGFYFNANLVNVRSWVEYIPGQLAPHANLTPVPYLWVATAYVGYFLPVVLLNVALMRRLARRFPRARLPALMAAGYALSLLMDLGLEGFALRTGTFAYPAASHRWSLWGGQTYQFPLIEMIGAPMFWVSVAALVLRTDADGHLPVERGAARVRRARAAALCRLLAVIGVVNVLFLVLPMGLPQLGVVDTDPFPSGYGLDLSGGWCGDQGQPYGPCPAPGVAWRTRAPGASRDAPPEQVYRTNRFFLTHPPAPR